MDVGHERPLRAGWIGATGLGLPAVVTVGLLSLALIWWADGLWSMSFRRVVPLLDNLMQARESLAEGHVWLEELLRGNPAIGVETVADAYGDAVAAVDDALEGRSAIRGLAGAAPEGADLVEALGKYRSLSEQARAVAEVRWQRAARGEAVEVPDLQLLSAFHGLGLVARGVNARLQDEVRGVIATQRRVRNLTLGLWATLLAGVSWALFVAGRRRWAAEEALRCAHSELERRVAERTAELVAANALLHSEIDERRRVEEALGRSERDLRSLSSRLLAFQEDERARLARELHDRIAQTLAAVTFQVEGALRRAAPGGAAAAAGAGESATLLLRETLGDVRRMYMDLRPTLLDDLGLVAAAEWFGRQFREAFPTVELSFQWSVAEAEVPEPLRIVIYRLLQECLTNAGRHAQATSATVRLERTARGLELTVDDDGIGFDAEAALALSAGASGLGLGSMRHRVEASGGTFSLRSAPGAGTRVRATWPLP